MYLVSLVKTLNVHEHIKQHISVVIMHVCLCVGGWSLIPYGHIESVYDSASMCVLYTCI